MVNGDQSWLMGPLRARSKLTNKLYRIPVFFESLTVNYMEIRGKCRNIWMTGPANRTCPFGVNLEFYHVFDGFVIPWNGSQVSTPNLPASLYQG
jgi:hypothetical protein